MTIRDATADDRDRLRELYEEFAQEIPPPPGIPVDIEHELEELDDYLGDQNVALVAEEDGGRVVGFALAKMEHPGIGHLSDLYVAPEARRQGAARELIREAATRLRDGEDASVLTLGVQVTNEDARNTYERLGFRPESMRLFAPIEHLLERSGRAPRGPSFGSVHVQTDDERAVEQAVRKYVPRFGRSAGSVVAAPRNGWTAVYDELCDREPGSLRRLGSELSNATGAVAVAIGLEEGAVVRYIVFERGSVVDEYLSVPEYFKPLPPGDAIALGANPTVVARLTGADPHEFRRIARTAEVPEELGSPQELLEQIAGLMGLSGAGHGYEGAAAEPGAHEIAHR
jgi:ribosomal protein S18 acetylase RimI-like enzyme